MLITYPQDRCAFVPKAQKHHVEAAMKQATSSAKSRYLQSQYGQMYTPDSSEFANYSMDGFMNQPAMVGGGVGLGANGAFPQVGGGNGTYPQATNEIAEPQRSIYIGNVPEGATVEELCNLIRGGNLQQIRYLPAKNCAVSHIPYSCPVRIPSRTNASQFVTFVECGSAAVFYSTAYQQGLQLRSCRLRVGWAKEEPTTSPQLLQAIHNGITRNVYIGGIKDFDLFTEEKLRTDFASFGEIEMVNFLKDKGAAFVNLYVPLLHTRVQCFDIPA